MTATYAVTYTLAGDATIRKTSVNVTEGYSTFGDIPKIVAVVTFGGNDAETVAKVQVISAVLIATRVNES